MAGYTMQKGFNPFLAEPEEPAYQYDQTQASNPFLADVAPSGGNENPFLFASQEPIMPAPSYSNPFADMVEQPSYPDTSNKMESWSGYGSNVLPTQATGILPNDNNIMQNDMYGGYEEEMLKYSNTTVPTYTKDLLETVTGALEATSDSLLDRLRVAQPSPFPQPPSPTPSPRTPSPVTPDLIGGFEDVPAPPAVTTKPDSSQKSSIVDLFDTVPPPASTASMDIMDLYKSTVTSTATTTISATQSQAPSLINTTFSTIAHEELTVPVEEMEAKPATVSEESVLSSSTKYDVSAEGPMVNEIAHVQPQPAQITPEPPQPAQIVSEPQVPVQVPKQAPPERPRPPPPVEKKSPLPSRPPPPAPSRPAPPAAAPQIKQSPFEQEAFISAAKPAQPPEPTPAFVVPQQPPQPEITYVAPVPQQYGVKIEPKDEKPADFDAFDQQFESLADSSQEVVQAWGDTTEVVTTGDLGFEKDDGFDNFLALTEPPPVPHSTPAKFSDGNGAGDDYEDRSELAVFIRPKDESDLGFLGAVPTLAPPPKSPAISTGSALSEDSQPFVPFLSAGRDEYAGAMQTTQMNRTDSQESPQTPLFEEDQSQPLEDFPRTTLELKEWEMHMRHPNKKKITGQRFWKKVYVRLVVHNDVPILQISNNKTDKDPIQEIPLQACYSISDIAAQQFDQYGKIFTAKLQYIFYKERPGVRPGQISKAGNITNKLSQFAAYAIQGDYQGVKEFGSDLRKLGLPVEHAPQISQLVKLGTQNFEEVKQFCMCIEEALFRLPVHRDRAITYKTEEIQVTLVDEYYVEQDIYGVVLKQIARVRLFFLSFLSGNTEIELGINDIRRQGKEVVGRHDIIPIATEEWIRTEAIEFSSCVQLDVFEQTKMVKFKPPDACYIELLRFRVRPPKQRELPLQVKTVFTTTGHRIEMRCDLLVPGFTSRKLGQIPCEDVMIRIPIPESWIYMFRVEKHFRYGSVKSAHRRSGKVKGIERFLGAVEAVENSLMEVTSGQAKYEHQHRSIVWRVSRLPKEGQGAYTTHSFFCHVTLQPHEEIPDNLTKFCYVEFTMPHTTVSHTVCRSISVPMCDEPPEKCVRYLSRHEYVVEIEHTTGVAPASYSLAATTIKEEPKTSEVSDFPETKMEGKAESDSDFSD